MENQITRLGSEFFLTGAAEGQIIFTAYDKVAGLRPEFRGEYAGLDASVFVPCGSHVKSTDGKVIMPSACADITVVRL